MPRPVHPVAACVCLLALAAACGRADPPGGPLPERAVSRLVATKPAGRVLAVFHLGDGTTAATWDDAGKKRLWDAVTGKETGAWHCAGADPGGLPWDVRPQGDWLAGPTPEGAVALWDVRTGKTVRTLQGTPPGEAAGLAFSPDGTRLAGAFGAREAEAEVMVWVAATGKLVGRWKVAWSAPWRLAFSPDGTTLALTGSGGAVCFLDTRSGRTWASRKEWPVLPLAVRFSPDGRLVAVSGPSPRLGLAGTTQVFEVDTGAPVWGWASEEARHGVQLAFSRDGRTLFVPDGRRVLLLDVFSGERRGDWAGHADDIRCLALSADGRRLLTGSDDRTALSWEVAEALPPPGPPRSLTEQQWKHYWSALAGRDATAAYRAMNALLSAPPQAVGWLKQHLRAVSPQQHQKVAKLISALDDKKFTVREQARVALLRLGEAALPWLEKALQAPPSLEARRRLEQLLAQVTPAAPGPETLRARRAVTLLEHLRTSGGRELLRELADGAPGALLTSAAQAALDRQRP